MKTIILYKFKNSITRKMPLLKEKSMLSSFNDLMAIDLLDTEIITEYTIDVPDDFNFEYHNDEELLELCKASQRFIDYHFITTLNDYYVI
ncbi:heme oxygenase [Chryseobacterium sp. B21-037]|uniref:heme oxygenase n=1 Tax=unclassified Chryseobacterium TaxID=2593645 RepID=UPI001555EB04|nr:MULTISPECIES: heme oxygenase [unclassified Chryseobacterium]MDC8104488.1 heme oxygenase [Chryseobacterium sp. B21-037]MDQ1804102.1 heme oxygenase [Chryseobacterium sp. CKR4-1]